MMERRAFLRCCGGCAAWVALDGIIPDIARGADVEKWTRTVCDLCGLGEPVFIGSRDGLPRAVKGIPNSTIGFGRLCPRVQALWAGALGERRALRPMIRRDPATKGTLEGLEPTTWEEAVQVAVRGFAGVRERLGPGGLAFLASDGETNETYHLLGKLARGIFGTDHLDTPARCDALDAYDACRDVFGVPGNTSSLEDVDAATLILLVGGDLAESHPALFYRVHDARRRGRTRVVLIDPRKTLAAGVADVHIQPRPGYELDILNSLAAEVMRDISPSAADPFTAMPETTETWRAWLGRQRESSPANAEIAALAGMWRDARAVTTLVGPTALSGPAGREIAVATAQLHRATGEWGRAGAGCLFLPRGANAAGVVAFGIAPGRLPGMRSGTDAQDRRAVAEAWDVKVHELPDASGLPAHAWPAAVISGEIGAMLVLRANPAVELPGAGAWRDALRSSFVVVAMTHSPNETEPFADVVLPLTLVAGESDGTMMNLARRCQLLERATAPPGEARTSVDVLAALAREQLGEAGFQRHFARYAAGPHIAWDEWRSLSERTPFDAKGITITRLRERLGLKWPCLSDADEGIDRIGPDTMTAARMTEGGRVVPPPTLATPHHFVATPLPETLPRADDEYPLLLIGGPLREHFRSRMRTGQTDELHYEAPTPRIEMHPSDGNALGIPDGEWVTLELASGQLTARVWLTDRSPQGVLFVPEHYGFLSDVQGGSDTVKEPEGLFHLVTATDRGGGAESPGAVIVPVRARKAKRRDMRRRGLSG